MLIKKINLTFIQFPPFAKILANFLNNMKKNKIFPEKSEDQKIIEFAKHNLFNMLKAQYLQAGRWNTENMAYKTYLLNAPKNKSLKNSIQHFFTQDSPIFSFQKKRIGGAM